MNINDLINLGGEDTPPINTNSNKLQDCIYTGYYANTNKYIAAGLIPVAISGGVPDFYKYWWFKKLAPSYSIFNDWKSGRIDNFGYTERYKTEILGKLDPKEISKFFRSADKSVILLCFEKSGDFCHRHIVADWFEEQGVKVSEYE